MVNLVVFRFPGTMSTFLVNAAKAQPSSRMNVEEDERS